MVMVDIDVFVVHVLMIKVIGPESRREEEKH